MPNIEISQHNRENRKMKYYYFIKKEQEQRGKFSQPKFRRYFIKLNFI
jgi:hypothetical protein